MRIPSIILISLICITQQLSAQPQVVVLPFDGVVDSVYSVFTGKESVLDHQRGIQQWIANDLGNLEEVRVVELADLNEYLNKQSLSPERWNDPKLASQIGSALSADYAIIGNFGEYQQEIRVDARVVVIATAEVPPEHTVSSTVSLLEDLPSAAREVANGLVPLLTAGLRERVVSRGVLFPEGNISELNPALDVGSGSARLTVWVDAPAPVFKSTPEVEFIRCKPADLSGAPANKLSTHACRVAAVPEGSLDLLITHRGYSPYHQTLNLTAGKSYRLEVELMPIQIDYR